MGVLNSQHSEVVVGLANVDSLDDPHTPIDPLLASVRWNRKEDLLKEGSAHPLGALIPLAASRLLCDGSVVPGFTAGLVELMTFVTDSLSDESTDQGQPLRLREVPQFRSPEAGYLFLTIPLIDDVEGLRYERMVRFLLLERRGSGHPWAKVKAPPQGGPIVAAGALFGVLQMTLQAEKVAARQAVAGLRALRSLWNEQGEPVKIPLDGMAAYILGDGVRRDVGYAHGGVRIAGAEWVANRGNPGRIRRGEYVLLRG